MRYTATIDFYVNAENEIDLIKKITKITGDLKLKYDNQAQLIELHETPFGSLMSKKIDHKVLQNKLLSLYLGSH